jgi:type IV secretory pathway TrbD component
MKRRAWLTVVLVAGLVVPPGAFASEAETPSETAAGTVPLKVGARVRVRRSSSRPRLVIGRAIVVDADGLEIERDDHRDSVRVPWSEMRTVEVSRGWNYPPGLIGAGTGAVVFAGLGAVAAGLGNLDCEHRCPSAGQGYRTVATGAAIGVVAGGLSGSVFAGDRWERVRTQLPIASLAVAPGRGGSVGAAVILRF